MNLIPSFLSKWCVILAILFSINACRLLNVDQRGQATLNTVPIYEGAEFLQESRTTYPDSTPSIIRVYQSDASEEQLLEYYQTILADQGWNVQVWDNRELKVPSEIVAEKDDWRISILIYSSGKFILQVFLG